MFVSCSTLCFASQSLRDALQTICDLRFAKADLAIHAKGPHLRPAEVLEDTASVYQRLRLSGVGFSAFHVDLGGTDEELATEQLRAIARLARLLAVPIITIPAPMAGSDWDKDVQRLTQWTMIVAAEGLVLTLETHSQTSTADPAMAASYCEQVLGLGITLDPSHYVIHDYPPSHYDVLMPFVKHVRLRDSGPGNDQFQLMIGHGVIEYGSLITHLNRRCYQGELCVDIQDIADSPNPIVPEVRKLKYLLESMV